MTKKRGNNEGTISRRRDGRWCAAITLGVDEDGKQKESSTMVKHVRKWQKSSTKRLMMLRKEPSPRPTKLRSAIGYKRGYSSISSLAFELVPLQIMKCSSESILLQLLVDCYYRI